jgi:HEPN domain-containing protein
VTANFKHLAETRLREARILLASSEPSGAYYLAGYAAECALKAVVLKQIRKYHMPDRKVVDQAHTHDFDVLVGLAGLKANREAYENQNKIFARNWALTRIWSESSRYEVWTTQDATDLITAVGQRRDGVLAWIRRSW